LAAEGLFAVERKRPLPFLPHSIGIVTSDKGAALHDMLRIIGDRYPDRRIVICPVKVQGDGSAREIAQAISDLNRFGAVDVIIAGRGGGSLKISGRLTKKLSRGRYLHRKFRSSRRWAMRSTLP